MSLNVFIQSSRRFIPEALEQQLNTMYDEVAYAVNVRDIGVYDTTANANGQLFFGLTADLSPRGGIRQLYTVSSILNGTTTIPTDPVIPAGTQITRLYGIATNGTIDLPLPYVDPSAGVIGLRKNGSNIELITNVGTYVGYTAIIIIEYVQ